MAYDQTNRILRIDTDLGRDAAVLTELVGHDSISKPFLFKIRFATAAEDDQVRKLLGTNVALWFGQPGDPADGPTGGERRVVHGRFRRLVMSATSRAGEREWQAEVVPQIWFLSSTSDLRIFQEKTVVEIIEEILKIHHVENFSIKTLENYPKIGYCVQYRESALDFICRLMEQYGLFFWHEHEIGRHTLMISDHNSTTFPAPFPELEVRSSLHRYGITELEDEFNVGSGTWTMRDFNFETPSNDLEVTDPTHVDVAETKKRELYDYPGLYPDKGAGKALARVQIQAEEVLYSRRRGEGVISGMDAGMRVRIAPPPTNTAAEKEYLLTEVRHEAKDYSHWTTDRWSGRDPEEPFYRNAFSCIPNKVPFRSQRRTPKPFVHGPQTAIVTGPKGEEIYTDKYARVKVQFHWDRLGRKDERSSCWVRVSQSWAGSGYGFIQIPRIGQEVIVDFLEGDPDRPIITGRVYNAEQMPPHGLPGAAVKSGLKSNSTKGGGGSNELTFDDTKGKEQTYFHSQYNHVGVIQNDETRTIVKGNRSITVQTGTHTETIKGDTKITVVTGAYTHGVATKTATRLSKQKSTLASTDADVLITAKTQIKLHVGDSSITMLADGTITIHGKNISILGDDSVTVSSKKVQITGSEEAKIGVGAQSTVYDKQKVGTSGAAINSAAVGQHEITGAIVKIN
ncbi:type VI secretion system tip protein VgrG [Roseomonas sp. JC162]|uniref:Type VI secretion system tip protein VgrG n=1 Tax=Neoroseomonas marina TaxID=1232220 RepID=A0A848ELZ0_9PROT|nr:type VI secretion system tip protein TssI/VgrG [Neoroseomonas marina]NMJ44383.1 type VI secretion system tip protein VgrG [Neoroseomonas marina]